MKLINFIFFNCFFISLFQFSIAWSTKDYEIFRVQDELEADKGKGVTFYSWIGLENGPKSSQEEITKAYRKLSRKIHPDKLKGKATRKDNERYARLSVISDILRDIESKKRYDFFLSHGFPRWRGTGYYYSRVKPGLLFSIALIFGFINVGQYVFLRYTAIGHRNHMSLCIKEAQTLAYGSSPEWGAYNDNFLSNGAKSGGKRKVSIPNGKIFSVYNDGSVHLVEKTKSGEDIEFPLNIEDIPIPGWEQTLIVQLPAKLYRKITGRPLVINNRSIDVSAPGQVLGTAGDEQDTDTDGDINNKDKNKNKNKSLKNADLKTNRRQRKRQ